MCYINPRFTYLLTYLADPSLSPITAAGDDAVKPCFGTVIAYFILLTRTGAMGTTHSLFTLPSPFSILYSLFLHHPPFLLLNVAGRGARHLHCLSEINDRKVVYTKNERTK